MEKLDLGMTMRQVEFLLGKPAIEDPYHADQWHYIYYFKSGSSGAIDKRVMRTPTETVDAWARKPSTTGSAATDAFGIRRCAS